MQISTVLTRSIQYLCLSLIGFAFTTNSSMASDLMNKNEPHTSAIVLAAFGTTYDSAVESLLAIKRSVEKAYPNTPVRYAFTSNIIRKKWHKRQSDQQYQQDHPEIPASFYQVKNVLGTLADLQNEGYNQIVVQTTLLSHGEEFIDLKAYVDALNSIETIKPEWKPFKQIALGRPLMGTWGKQYSYSEDIEKLATSLVDDVEQAKAQHSALVYMGHGNDHLSTGLYYELEEQLNQLYPDLQIYVGLVEGHPNFAALLQKLKNDRIQTVMIKPLMVVAGDHANNDMAGDEDDSWKVMLSQNGIAVTPILEGLGSNDKIQQLYLQHLRDAAKDGNITLK